MLKVCLSIAATGLMVLTGSAMGGGMSMSTGGEHFAFGHPGAGSGPVQVIHIRALDDLRFQPTHVTVERGETVKFVVTNVGKLAHEFVIGDAAEQAAHEKEMQAIPGMPMEHDVNGVSLPPGQTRNLVWTFTRDGTVEYACHVPGHFYAGMIGKIIVKSPAHH